MVLATFSPHSESKGTVCICPFSSNLSDTKMKNVLCLIIFSFGSLAFVMSNQHLNRRGGSHPTREKTLVELTTKVLADLMAPNKPIKIGPMVSDACRVEDMKANCDFSNPQTGIYCNFGQTTCYVVAEWYKSSWIVSVISKTKENPQNIPPDSDQIISNLAVQAVFLPYMVDRDTYTILNPAVARWFFTDNLGGCDVFVATAAYQGSHAMVIHSNRNMLIKDLAMDLQTKGKDVDKILKRKSKSDGYEWKVIARVYYGPTTEPEKGDIGLNRYADEHPGIKLIGYQTKPGSEFEYLGFFGHFIGPISANILKIPPCWRFIFKEHSTGTILGEFKVSLQGNRF